MSKQGAKHYRQGKNMSEQGAYRQGRNLKIYYRLFALKIQSKKDYMRIFTIYPLLC